MYAPVRQLPGQFFDPATFQTSENAARPESAVAAPKGFDSLQALFQAGVAAHCDRAAACHMSQLSTASICMPCAATSSVMHVSVHNRSMFWYPNR